MVARMKISPTFIVDEAARKSQTALEAPAATFQKVQRVDSLSSADLDSSEDERVTQQQQQQQQEPLSSSPPTAGLSTAPDATQLRSKFLNRLGISPPPTDAPSRVRKPRSLRKDADSYTVGLTGQAAAEKVSRPFRFFQKPSSVSSDSTTDSKPFTSGHLAQPTKGVHFGDTVTVHPILKHSAYSRRIRRTVWTDAREMQENVARNCLEFQAEGWELEGVLDDHAMVLYEGERIHPVHFAHLQTRNVRQQFCAVMSAQHQQS
jgi:hypothetical protein